MAILTEFRYLHFFFEIKGYFAIKKYPVTLVIP